MELDYYWSSAQSGRMNAMVSTGNDPRILNLTIFSIVSFCWNYYILWIGSWLGFTNLFEGGFQEKNPCSYRESKLDPSVPTHQSTEVLWKWT